MITTREQPIGYYELLGVPTDATAEEIRAALRSRYARWARRLSQPQLSARAYALWVLRTLDQAERVLCDSRRRRAYDSANIHPLHGGQWSTAPSVAQDWHDRAHSLLDGDNPAAAHRVAQEATLSLDASPAAWMSRGYASAHLERFADAEYELAEATRLMPAEALPRYLLAEVYAAQKKWELALTKVDEALARSPDTAPMVVGKAVMWCATGRDREAVGLLEQVVARFPDDDLYTALLAAAYHDAAINALTPAPCGRGSVLTSREQIDGLRHAAEMIDSLGSGDPQAADLAGSLRDLAARGVRYRWDLSTPHLHVVLAAVVFVLGGGAGAAVGGGLGAGLAAGLVATSVVAGGLFTLLRRKPAWRLSARALEDGNLSDQIITGAFRVAALVYRA